MRRYTVVLIPDAEVGGYTVTVPALPGCITEGDTLDEALENAREIIAFHLECLRAEGRAIPEDHVARALEAAEATPEPQARPTPQLATVEV